MEPELYERRGYLLEDYRLFHLRDTDMAPVEWHYHDFHKLIFFLSGQAGYAVEGQRYELRPGDIVLVGRGDIHRPEVVPGAPYERAILYLSPDLLAGMSEPGCALDACFALARKDFCFVLRPPAEDGRFPQLLQSLERAAGEEGFGQAQLCRALLVQLLIEVGRGQRAKARFHVPTASCDEKVAAILRYLNGHLTEPVRVDDLAARFFVSRYHLMRRFRQETGYTVHAYLVGKRLLLARSMLSAGKSAAAACYGSGFQDYSTFSRAFKKQFGKSPRELAR